MTLPDESFSMSKYFRIFLLIVILLAGLAAARRILKTPAHKGAGSQHEAAAPDYSRGPHNGRLLTDGDLGLEVTIYEPEIPPQFHVYPYRKGRPLDPAVVKLVIELHRFLGRVDTINFKKEGDYLAGDKVVEEPHSFEVKVTAEYQGRKSQWTYQSYEGRVTMAPAALETAGIKIEEAGPAKLRTLLPLNGKMVPLPDKVAQVTPRYPGVILEARKKLGEPVEKNETLAVLESNESLTPYEIRSQISGQVVKRNAVLGQAVTQNDTLYIVADLSTIAVDLAVPREEFAKLRLGQKVIVRGGEINGEAVISYLSPLGAENTQTLLARTEMPNDEKRWQPGLFVTAEVVVDETEVPIAVKTSALQTFRDWQVVFLNEDNTFEIGIVELGRRDGDLVEVVSGPLTPGTKYVTQNSFVVKAEVMKSGATHEH